MNWIQKNWSTIGGIIGLMIVLIVFLEQGVWYSLDHLVWLHLSLMMFHQFEEYSFPGHFTEFYNTNLAGKNPITKFPLTKQGVLLVNIALAWSFYLLGAIIGTSFIWFTIGLALITLINGIMHIFMYFRLKRYNPGFITSIIFFVPFGIYLLKIISQTDVNAFSWILGALVGIVGVRLIPLTINFAYRHSKKNYTLSS